jgi:hypothetical protein
MAEIFRSALNYISQTGKSGNDFVGQYVELGPVQLRVRRVIAEGNLVDLSVRWNLVCCLSFVRECNARFITANLIYTIKVLCQHFYIFSGGYGFVFVAQDTSTGKEYALKVKFNGSHVLFIDYFFFLFVINVKI